MKCIDLHDAFVKAGAFVDWSHTTDSFKIGDPEREVRTIATVWKPTWEALRHAHAQGAELVVAHESLFVKGGAGSEESLALPSENGKRAWLQKTGLVVYRCHDLWDRFPDIGIRWSWQKGLELGGTVVEDVFPLLVTETAPMTVGELAAHVLERIRPLGQTHVAVVGDLERTVSRIATGTGVTPDPIGQWKLGAEAGIMTDDYFLLCREGAHAMEREYPMIVVNHGVCEEWGVENLAEYIQRQNPDLRVLHIPQRCVYRTIGSHP